MFNSSIAIQVLPNSSNKDEVIRIVDSVIEFIKTYNVNYTVGPFETVIEGDFDLLMEILKESQKIAIKNGADSIMSYVKINYQPKGGVLTIDEKISKYK